jgi:glycosyltransferase involved in cell wall biosynthesis
MEDSPTRVTCVVKRYHHHTPSGGYDRLAAAVGAQVIRSKEISGLFGKVANKVWSRVTDKDKHSPNYGFGDWLAELQALATGFFRPPDVLHVLYGGQINLLINWRNLLRCPLIVTFHAAFAEAPHRFDVRPRNLGVDFAVVVANSQIAPLQRWIEPRRIVYIPHGIDTNRFKPGGSALASSARMRVVIVGEHMRDWLVMHKVIDEINRRGLDIEFHLVINEKDLAYFTGCANVVYHPHISEAELIDLYRSADALFIPMTNSTANNSILEALACGTPIISSRVGGVPDYVDDKSGWLLPVGDVAGHVNLIASISANRELSRGRRQAARIQALKFDWRVIAEQMVALYATAKFQKRAT